MTEFEKWFKSYSEELYHSPPLDVLCHDGWRGCKERVMDILNDALEGGDDLEEATSEIRKLI